MTTSLVQTSKTRSNVFPWRCKTDFIMLLLDMFLTTAWLALYGDHQLHPPTILRWWASGFTMLSTWNALLFLLSIGYFSFALQSETPLSFPQGRLLILPRLNEVPYIAQYFYSDRVFQLLLNCFALICSNNWLRNSLWASLGKWPYLKHLGTPNILQDARHKINITKITLTTEEMIHFHVYFSHEKQE